MPEITLGLDIGPNSIGWALLDEANQRIIDLGSRIFPEGVDNFDTSKEKSRNEQRRDARLMRRQVARRSRRERRLRQMLVKAGLFPHDPEEHEELNRVDPYELRAKALDERLTPCEIGRVFLHLNQRRGFLSNRKKDRDDKETKGMLAEISELARDMEATGARTLGEYLFGKCESFDHARRREDDHIRNRHTRRDMLEKEFDAIWEAQAKHHPQLLTETLRYGESGERDYPRKPVRKPERKTHLEAFGIHGIIFFQRKMYWPKSVVGLCELEPKEKRCPRADRQAQRFRLLQEVNNLRYIDPDAHEERPLDPGQRALLLDHLATREKATFDEIRKKLGFLESVNFNLERGKRPSLKGIIVDWQIAKAVGNDWHKRPEDDKNTIARMLIHNEGDDDAIEDRLVKEFGFSDEQADTALRIDFPPGYVGLSLKAIEKLLPHMERGLVYQSLSDPEQSALHAAGYLRRDELQRRLFDRLPDPARMNPRDCPIGDIPNPVVKRTLVELRKVVNAIIREYGKPDAVHVEMGRDVKTRPTNKTSLAYKKYKEREEARAEQERKRTAAKVKLRESGVSYGAGGRNILKYLLWEEQGQYCIYSGRPIGFAQLMSEEIEIDHILPKSQSLDDSFMNKVVCFHSENRTNGGKGQKTPREWLEASNAEKFKLVCQRAKNLPYPKYARFLRKIAKCEDFIERQLNDTRYIAKATVEFLHTVIEQKSNVIGLKGQLTSTLRRIWGLDTMLSQLPDSPAWVEQSSLRPGLKNRADHRHHAIDAVVVALTDRSRLQQLSRGFTVEEFGDEETGERELKTVYRGEHISVPWPDFRSAVVEAIRQIDGRDHGEKYRRGVSHRPKRKVGFALHKDQPFGRTRHLENNDGARWVKRKPLAGLSASEVLAIRDETVREIVQNHLGNEDIRISKTKPTRGRPKLFFEDTRTGKVTDAKAVLENVSMPSGVPIRRVRLLIKNQTIRAIREKAAEQFGDKSRIAYVEPDELHHACLFQWCDGNKTYRGAAFVPQLVAMQRLSTQQRHLSERIKQWKHECVSPREIKRLKRHAMHEIAIEHPVIQRDAGKLDTNDVARIPPDAEFLFSLSTGDTLLVEVDGHDRLMVVSTLVSTQARVHLVDAADARKKKKDIGLTPNSLIEKYNARKVAVDPLGRIRWAND